MANANGFNDTAPSGCLRDRRHEAGLTQQQLAELGGCSLSYVRLLEGGFTPKRASNVLPRLLAALKSTHDERRPTEAASRKVEASQCPHPKIQTRPASPQQPAVAQA